MISSQLTRFHTMEWRCSEYCAHYGGPAQVQNGFDFHALLWPHDAFVAGFLFFYLIIRPSSKLSCAL